MKKIIAFATAAVAAVAVQASTVTWSYPGDVYEQDGATYAYGTAWLVWLGDSTDTSTITVDNTGNISAGTYAVRATDEIGDGQVAWGGAIDTVENANGNAVFVAAYKDAGANLWYYTVTDPLALTGVSNGDATHTINATFPTQDLVISTQAVPEPTSVALLALGLAALGLKRKVA